MALVPVISALAEGSRRGKVVSTGERPRRHKQSGEAFPFHFLAVVLVERHFGESVARIAVFHGCVDSGGRDSMQQRRWIQQVDLVGSDRWRLGEPPSSSPNLKCG